MGKQHSAEQIVRKLRLKPIPGDRSYADHRELHFHALGSIA
jgi:hypothetical protein